MYVFICEIPHVFAGVFACKVAGIPVCLHVGSWFNSVFAHR
jgi:hypothetical protein